MEKRADLRVVKTREAIESAFISLLAEKPFERITVQNILDEARVNRKTFYSHYADKYALADLLIERQLDMFSEALDERLSHDEWEDAFPEVLRAFYQTMDDNRAPLLALMDVRTEKHFMRDEFEALLKESYCDRVSRDEAMDMDDLMLDYLSSYYAASAASSIRWFLETTDKRALDIIEEVAHRSEESPAFGFVSTPFVRH